MRNAHANTYDNTDSHRHVYAYTDRDSDIHAYTHGCGHSYGNTDSNSYAHDVSLPRLRNDHGHRRDRARHHRHR